MGKSIYEFNLYLYYANGISHFVAEDADVEILYELKAELSFSEIEGKHSEYSEVISKENLTVKTDDEAAVKMFLKYGLSTGVNPFECEIEVKTINPELHQYFLPAELSQYWEVKEIIDRIKEKRGF